MIITKMKAFKPSQRSRISLVPYQHHLSKEMWLVKVLDFGESFEKSGQNIYDYAVYAKNNEMAAEVAFANHVRYLKDLIEYGPLESTVDMKHKKHIYKDLSKP